MIDLVSSRYGWIKYAVYIGSQSLILHKVIVATCLEVDLINQPDL